MKSLRWLFLFILGMLLAPLLIQWIIIYTREPAVLCDGGEVRL